MVRQTTIAGECPKVGEGRVALGTGRRARQRQNRHSTIVAPCDAAASCETPREIFAHTENRVTISSRGGDRVGEASLDIAAWLDGLGLQQYKEAFRDNAIDAAILPELTADDLRDLGVGLVGHRRKLLAAIAALRNDSWPEPAVERRETVDTATAERRQLTVMFCDLVGSTALSARLDPEDLREIIAAYHRAVAEIITRAGGFVSRYMGDGVLVYFGFPQAHEDDAERAVRAGLGAIDAVRRLEIGSVKLQARVGIATGLVVVGDLIGHGAAQEQSVVGETPNLAARLQALAEPETVVIAVGTRRLVGALFEYRDLGAIEVKGIAGPCRHGRCCVRVLSRAGSRRCAEQR
jgi:class 3 adenylate cyclase